MSWGDLQAELRRRRDAGRPAEFWWRDDDAGAPSPELERLLRMARDSGVPLCLAAVPEAATPGLFALLHKGVTLLQHGTDHRNRAAAGEKKTEYPAAEAAEAALARIASGHEKLRALGAGKVAPVLVPPWNRLRKDLVPRLHAAGIRGLSQYGKRERADPAPGLRQVNTHVDIVAWNEAQRFIGEDAALALAMKSLAYGEPVGWLTHHAVHDAQAWRFLEQILKLQDVRWLSAAQAFSYTGPAHG